MLEIKEVLRAWRAGEAKKRIAARLGTDIKTVRRYVKTVEKLGLGPETDLDSAVPAVVEKLEATSGRPRGVGWERCTGQRDFIVQKLKDGVRLRKIRKLLLRRQVRISYMTLYRFAVEELGLARLLRRSRWRTAIRARSYSSTRAGSAGSRRTCLAVDDD